MYTYVATISESEPLTESQGRSDLIRFPVCPWHQLEVRLQVPEDLSRANQKFKERNVSEYTCHVHVADHIHCVHLVHTPYQWLRSNDSVVQVASVACMQQGSCSVKYISKYITFLSKWQHRFCVYPSCDVPGSPERRALHSYHQYPDRYPDIWIRIPWCGCLPRVPGPIRFSLQVNEEPSWRVDDDCHIDSNCAISHCCYVCLPFVLYGWSFSETCFFSSVFSRFQSKRH